MTDARRMPSSNLEEFREAQMDLKLLAQALGSLNDEEKAHPRRVIQGKAGLEDRDGWERVKGEFTRRREYLKKHLSAKEERRDYLYLQLSQTPLPMASLAEVIDKLTEIEAAFAVKSPSDAWDKISALIDWLEKDEARVNELIAA